VELERRYIDEKVDKIPKIHNGVYTQLKRQYGAQGRWMAERTEEIRQQLANLRRQTNAVGSLRDMRDQLVGKIRYFSAC